MEGFSKEKLKRIRLQLGLSQRNVPGVAQDTLSALESGRREPRPSTLKRLAAAYGVEVRDFFEESQGKANASPSSAAERTADEERRLLELVREQLSELNRIASRLEEVAVARPLDVVKWRQADEGFEDVVSSLFGSLGDLRNQGVNVAEGSLADEVERAINRLRFAQLACIGAAQRPSGKTPEEERVSEDEVNQERQKAEHTLTVLDQWEAA